MASLLFWIALLANSVLLVGMLSSLSVKQNTQFWPPPSERTWQYHTLWWSVRVIAVSIVSLAFLEWGIMELSDRLRYWVALPIFCVTFSLGCAAALNLGWTNTHGIENGFIENGFYKYSRNPQYVLFSISFIATSILVASPKALVLLWLLAFWYLIAPFPEERWLEDRYGEQYLEYKQRVPRYF